MATRPLNTRVSRVLRDPAIQFGAPTVAGSRTTVAAIVSVALEGEGVDGILYDFPHLSAADVADALAYYLQHRAELDAVIFEDAPRNGGA